MYDVSDVLPAESVPVGTNVLIGGSESAARDVLRSLLADGVRRGQAALVLSTGGDAAAARSALRSRGPEGSGANVGVVAVGTDGDGGGDESDPLTRRVDSPRDFAGAGVATSELLAELGHRHGAVRVGVDSVSGLLAHADAKTVFRFLHVLTGRVAAAEAVGFATLAEGTHDDRTVTTIRQLFDALVEFREDGSTRALRVSGLPEADGEWVDC